jgi:hypothetical protein
MKKIKVLLAMMLVSAVCYSQDSTSTYTREQLESTGKLSLTTIYLNQVNELVKMLPNVVFTSYNLKNDVPNNRYVNSRREKVAKGTEQYNEEFMRNYKDILPYADKKDLVEGILYMQGVLNKIRGGAK